MNEPRAHRGVKHDPAECSRCAQIVGALEGVERWLSNSPEPGAQERLAEINEALIEAEAAAPSPVTEGAGRAAGELDAAWREAEAALPERTALRLHGSVVRRGEAYYAEAIRDLTAAREGHGWDTVEDGFGPTPAAALRALAARLDSQGSAQGREK